MNLRTMWLLVIAFGLAGKTAEAGLLAYEGFGYAPAGSTLVGNNGGFGFSGGWAAGGFNAQGNANYTLADGSLSFPGLATSGNRINTDATQTIAGIQRTLNTVFGDGQTVYFSFLVQPLGTLGNGAFNGFFGMYLGTNTANLPDNLFIGKSGGGTLDRYVMETRGGGGQVVSNTAPVVGQTELLVVKAELLTGNDRFTLFVDPTPGAPEPVSTFIKTDINSSTSGFGINSVVVYSSGAFALDEIRVGTTFADVTTAVPEPASLGIFGLGFVGLLSPARFRKRRSF